MIVSAPLLGSRLLQWLAQSWIAKIFGYDVNTPNKPDPDFIPGSKKTEELAGFIERLRKGESGGLLHHHPPTMTFITGNEDWMVPPDSAFACSPSSAATIKNVAVSTVASPERDSASEGVGRGIKFRYFLMTGLGHYSIVASATFWKLLTEVLAE